MFKALLKSRLLAMFSSVTQGKKKKVKSKGSIVALSIVFLLLAVYFIGAMSVMFYGICLIAKETGDYYSVFTLGIMISSALALVGSIFATKTQIFESTDNELLLSMPIKPRYIFLSRMLVLLFVNLLLESVVMLPCIVVYGIVCTYNPLGLVFAIGIYILIPFLTLALSSLIGWMVAEISSRMKNKTLVTVVSFVVFFLGYMYLCFMVGYGSEEEAVDLSFLKNTFIFYQGGKSVSEGAFLPFLYFSLFVIAISVAVYIALDKSFIRIITTKRARAKIKYSGNSEKRTDIGRALLKKEIRKFFSSPAYIMNGGMGNLMCVIFAVMIFITGEDMVYSLEISGLMTQIGFIIPCVPVIVMSFMASTNIVSAPSFSLEDKNLWILKSSPVNPVEIIMAKVKAHIVICTPLPLIGTLIASFPMGLNVAQAILSIAVVFSFVCIGAYWGMLMGIKFPKFGWQNENVAVKQGMAIMGAMFGAMLYSIALCALGILSARISSYLAYAVMLLPSILICMLIHLYFIKRGKLLFDNLKQ